MKGDNLKEWIKKNGAWNKGKKGVMPIPWNLGKKYSNPKLIGRHHSIETKEKIGRKSKEMWSKKGVVDTRFNLRHGFSINRVLELFKSGMTLRAITKTIKVSEPTIRRIILDNGFTRRDILYRANKVIGSNTKQHRQTQVLPKKDTSIEIKIQNYLKQLNIDFFTHQYIKIEHGYQCDIMIPSMNLVIECDGNYWHRYPVGNDIDHIRTSELISKGFKVLRLWESEIKVIDLDKFQSLLMGAR